MKGDFVSDFVGSNSRMSNFSSIELAGRPRLKNANSIEVVGLDPSVRYQKFELIKDVEIFPLEKELFPLEKNKKLTLKDVILYSPEIEDFFHHSGQIKGRLKGVLHGVIVEEINVARSKPVKTSAHTNGGVENSSVKSDNSIVESASAVKNNGRLGRQNRRNRFTKNPVADKGCGSGIGSTGCGSVNGCNGCTSYGGCAPLGNCSSILSMLMRLLGLLFGLLFLISLFRMCNDENNNSGRTESRETEDQIVDTVKVYEIDTVDRLIKDTVFSVDTLNIVDTVFTVISKALPLPNVLFKTNSSIIRYSSLEGISILGDSLRAHEEISLIIAGHTDGTGDFEHNDTLSFCRAKSVKDYLIDSCLIASNRVKIEGYGERCPIEDNDSEEGKTTNRRVEFRYFNTPSNCAVPSLEINEKVCFTNKFKSGIELSVNLNDTSNVFKEKEREQKKIVIDSVFTLVSSYDFGNIRVSDSDNSAVLFRVFQGDKFELLEYKKQYSKIRFKGVVGYVLTEKIKPILSDE